MTLFETEDAFLEAIEQVCRMFAECGDLSTQLAEASTRLAAQYGDLADLDDGLLLIEKLEKQKCLFYIPSGRRHPGHQLLWYTSGFK